MTPDKKTPKNPRPKRRTPIPRPTYTAQEKVQAILAVWTDRCPPTEVCRQLQIPWVSFNQWQKRALTGMLQALEPRTALNQALSPRLQKLLNKHQHKNTLEKLGKRLEQIPQTKLAKPGESSPKMA